jgi:N-formylglutamate amidohydrolase
MNALQALPETEVRSDSPVEIRRPEALRTPLIFASPHSGRLYPDELLKASLLDRLAIRRSEDALVDELIAGGLERGAALVLCRTARAFVDVNRDPWELDPAMFEDELPAFARSQTARVAAGLGSIARLVAEGQEIYARKLTFAEAQARIEQVHDRYHQALAALVEEVRGRFGVAVLIDWHSMPSAAGRSEARRGRTRPDMVLGDRHGASCGRALWGAVRRELEAMGYAVALNSPYAGGFTTQTYGRPQEGVHTLQIELDRGLYLDETTLEPSDGFALLKRRLERLFDVLAAADWPRLLRAA